MIAAIVLVMLGLGGHTFLLSLWTGAQKVGVNPLMPVSFLKALSLFSFFLLKDSYIVYSALICVLLFYHQRVASYGY
jgi:hypothetical protein